MSTRFKTWSEGFAAIRARAETLRGLSDDAEPCPLTTNGDVLAVASVLDPELTARAIRFRDDGRGAAWREITDELNKEAATGDFDKLYRDNRAFWSVVGEICTYLDDVPVPELWGALADHLGDPSLRNAGPKDDAPFAHAGGVKTFDDMWRVQRDYLAERRGFDKPDPPPGMGMPGLKIPRTTHADVLQLATYWSEQLAKVKQVMGYKDAVEKWHRALADVDKYARSGKPDDVYPKNNEFWHTTSDVSIQIAIGDESPSKWDLALDSAKASASHLPQTLGAAASKGVDLVAGAAHAAGKIANEAGRGLFAGFGTPLLIGGGLLGLYLISRSKHEHAEE